MSDSGYVDLEDRLSRWRRTRVNPTPRVLVVDDEEDFLELSEMALTKAGFGVIKARSGDEALRLSAEDPPDIAFLDLYIPGGDGFQIMKALRAQTSTRDIPIFATTGADLDDAEGVLRVGFDGHFPKPVNWSGLRDIIRKLCGGKDA
jgi:two-component system sensor histidine kinase/response regulator